MRGTYMAQTTRPLRKRSGLADLLSRRGLERPCEALVAWARQDEPGPHTRSP
jgi:hypothetical protein